MKELWRKLFLVKIQMFIWATLLLGGITKFILCYINQGILEHRAIWALVVCYSIDNITELYRELKKLNIKNKLKTYEAFGFSLQSDLESIKGVNWKDQK